VGRGWQLDVLREARQQRDALEHAPLDGLLAPRPLAQHLRQRRLRGRRGVVTCRRREHALGQRLALGAGGQRLRQLGVVLEVASDDGVEGSGAPA
jgi:hypothetical protein